MAWYKARERNKYCRLFSCRLVYVNGCWSLETLIVYWWCLMFDWAVNDCLKFPKPSMLEVHISACGKIVKRIIPLHWACNAAVGPRIGEIPCTHTTLLKTRQRHFRLKFQSGISPWMVHINWRLISKWV